MSMIPTKLTDRDAEFAALLGHKQTESTWKPTLFLIARFREESEQLARKEIQAEIAKATKELVETAATHVQGVLPKNMDLPPRHYITTDPSAFVHKLDDSVIWAMFASATYSDNASSPESKAARADHLLAVYKMKFGNG